MRAVAEQRSSEIAELFSEYSKRISKTSLEVLLENLEETRREALKIAQGEFEKSEVEKRYLEQKLFSVCERSTSTMAILNVMADICKYHDFDRERLAHVILLGLKAIESRV